MRTRTLFALAAGALIAGLPALYFAPELAVSKPVAELRQAIDGKPAATEVNAPAKSAEAVKVPDNAPAITVVEARRMSMTQVIPVDGTILPRQEAAVGIDLNGLIVTELLADAGDTVRQGDVLARLDATSLKLQLVQVEAGRAQIEAQVAQARAQIGDAEVGVRQATEQLDRLEPLRKKGTASQAQYDNAVNGVDSARAKLTTAQKALAAAEAQLGVNQAQWDDLNRKIESAVVRAPANGIVLGRMATLGGIAGMSAGPLFRIAIDGDLELSARVPENWLPALKPGMTAEVSITGLPAPLTGEIRLVSPEIDRVSRLGSVRIALPKNDAVRAGGFGEGNIVAVSREAVAIPAGSLLFDGAQAYLQRVEDGVVKAVSVRTGIRSGSFVEIAEGLSAGDLVVARAGTFLADGDRITPVVAENTAAVN